MADYNELKKVIQEFNAKLPRPNLTLILGELSPIVTKEKWQNADAHGIYFLFDQNNILQYIGKASASKSDIGKRIGGRFFSTDCRFREPKFQYVTQIATIALPNDRIFEASSIEEYLIGRMKPPLNSVGTK